MRQTCFRSLLFVFTVICIVTDLEQVVRAFYAAVSGGDAAGVIALLSDDIVWSIPGPKAVPYAGTYHGKAGVEEFFEILHRYEDLQSFKANELIVDRERGVVCVLGCEIGVAIETGKAFSANWAEVFWIKDGLIAAFEEHIDTHALAAAYSHL